jgi:hypothetical protein
VQRLVLATLLMVLCFTTAACASVNETIRYKMTISVETPEGIKTGSGVREASYHYEKSILPEQGGAIYAVSGEAVVVDLGQRGLLFSIVDDDAKKIFQLLSQVQNKTRVIFFEKDLIYKRFVMFKDIHDPKSVVLVKGGEFDIEKQDYVPVDRFKQIFGKGTQIKDVTIAITDEPMVWKIDKYLPWLPSLKGSYLHGKSTAGEAPLGLHTGYFKTGSPK